MLSIFVLFFLSSMMISSKIDHHLTLKYKYSEAFTPFQALDNCSWKMRLWKTNLNLISRSDIVICVFIHLVKSLILIFCILRFFQVLVPSFKIQNPITCLKGPLKLY
jgi:hypothetical protein